MITVEECRDSKLLTEILKHPEIYKHISDDGSPKREDFEALVGEPIVWLLIKNNEAPAGAFLLHPHNVSIWEVHTNILPEHRNHSLDACKACWKWLLGNTNCKTLTTKVPAQNKPARRLAKAFGMSDFGLIPNGWLKGGQYQDIQLMGVTK